MDPLDDDLKIPEDGDMAEPTPMELPTSMLSMDEDAVPEEIARLAEGDGEVSDTDEYEVLDDVPAHVQCPQCGTKCNPSDTVCLACGTDIGTGDEGLINKLLKVLPMQAWIGIGAGLAVLLVGYIGWSIYASGADDRLVARGRTDLELNDYNSAIEKFEGALTWDPNNIDARLGLFEAGVLKGNERLIMKNANIVKRAASGRNDDGVDKSKVAATFLLAAEHYFKKDKFSECDRMLKSAESLGSKGTRNLELKGHLAFAKGESGDAKKHYLAAVEAGSEDAKVALNLARIERADGNLAEAEGYIQKAMKASPAEAHVELARISESRDKGDEALDHWKKAVEANPSLHSARLGLANILLRRDEAKAALEHAEQAKSLRSDDIASRLAVADCKFRLKDYDEAVEECDWVLEKDKQNVAAQFFKGAVTLNQGVDQGDKNLIRKGKSMVQRAVGRRKDAASYREAALIFLKIDSEKRTARKLIEDAIKLKGDDIELHKVRILVLEKAGNAKDVMRAINEALKVAPNDRELNVRLADSLWLQEDYDKALEIYKKAIPVSTSTDQKLLYNYALKLFDHASNRDNDLSRDRRRKCIEEALQILEKQLKDRLKSDISDLDQTIQNCKIRLLEFS